MKNYVHEGDALDLIAPTGGVIAGKGFKIGAIIALATTTALAGVTVSAVVKGVFDVDSDTGTAWAVGDIVYWDDTAKVFTKTTTSNTKAGYVVVAKVAGAVSGRVRLQPAF